MAAKAKKPKQQFLSSEMEPPRIKEIDSAADIYYDVMTDRCRLSKDEDEAKTNLIEKMKAHGLDLYETPDGLVVSILNKSNAKVKKKQDAEENGEVNSDE